MGIFRKTGKKMKLIILGGFLGTGKTTILMPLAREIVENCEGGDQKKLCIIENEVGTVGVDSAFTDGELYEERELFNGCVCCTLLGPLIDCLEQLAHTMKPEWVILEATGLARPMDIAEQLWEYYDENMNITTLVAIDATRWMKITKVIGELVYDQVDNADYVLINKKDLVTEDEMAEIEADIADTSDAKIYELSALKDPEGLEKMCKEVVKEILSWE